MLLDPNKPDPFVQADPEPSIASQDELGYCKKQSSITFGNSTRYVIFILSLYCLAVIFANSLALNFTIICMTADPTDKHDVDGDTSAASNNAINGTFEIIDNKVISVNESYDERDKAEYSYTPQQQGWLFSAVAIGSFIGAIPLPVLTSYFGTRIIFTVYGTLSGLSMLFTPTAASIGYALLFLMRVFQGIAVASLLPASGSIVQEWAAVAEAGFAIAFLSCHQQLGQIFTMPIAGLFCEYSGIGWQGIYYLLGSMTLAGFAMFFFFFQDTARHHVNVSHDELETITYYKDCDNYDDDRSPPYLKIFKDKSIIGVWIASIGGYTGFQLFSQYGPTYLNKVLDMDIQQTGFTAALPFIGALAVKLISGPLSDHLTIISQQKRCILFASISQFLMAFCIFALGWMPIQTELFAKIAYTVAIMASSLNVVGVVKSAQLQSRQHAHVTMTVIAFINSAIVLLLPIFVSTLSPNNSPNEWPKIFYIIAILVTITTIIFNFTCETDPRPWTRQSNSNSSNNKKQISKY